MTIDQRIEVFSQLGIRIKNLDQNQFDAITAQAQIKNAWFTKDNIRLALDSIASMISKEKLIQWIAQYDLVQKTSRKVGIVMAGNIPLVGFHDLLSVIISGHHAVVKMSHQDDVLMKFVIDQLVEIEPGIASQITIVNQLKQIEAVIATGSDNTSRYFEYYFDKYPHIIRKNRSSIAILTGKETQKELSDLAFDVYSYFGLGCRNVSKIYLPKDFDIKSMLDIWQTYGPILDHHKYRNNYDYHKSILLVNREKHLDTGFSLLKESADLISPLSVLYLEYYEDLGSLLQQIEAQSDKIQCKVSIIPENVFIAPGKAQQPELWEYADGVDTLTFLQSL